MKVDKKSQSRITAFADYSAKSVRRSDRQLMLFYLAALAADPEDPKRALAIARRAIAVWEKRDDA